jgi:hypothetical protein
MTDKTLEEMNEELAKLMNEELAKLMDDIEDVPKNRNIDGIEYSLHNKEFNGSKWVKELYFRELGEVSFSVFVNNQYLKEGRRLKLIKKVDNEIIDQAEFQLSGEKLFEGWFKLG